jgi:acyl-CoA thioesterase-2
MAKTMSKALQSLLQKLDLERIEDDIYRGQNEESRWGRLFGGQVAAQALAASLQTITGRRAHSLHGYFLRGGDPEVPVVYTVDRIRDGSSFSTRRVVALQHGRAIFNMAVSFHVEEDGYEHQDEMPEVGPPESFPSWSERAKQAGQHVPEPMRTMMKMERPIEMRSEAPNSWFATEPQYGPNRVWVRANGELGDDPALHELLLTYASDMGFVDNIYRPHRQGPRNVMIASLDHSIWFHRDFRIDDWLLYVQDSPTAFGARGFVRGTFFDRQGRLVCSVAQEGLMRKIDPSKTRRPDALEPQR